MNSLHNRLTILLAIAVVSSVLLLAESVSVSPASADVIDAPTCSTGGAVPDAANNPGLVSDCESLLVGRDTLAGKATLDWSAGRPIGIPAACAMGRRLGRGDACARNGAEAHLKTTEREDAA